MAEELRTGATALVPSALECALALVDRGGQHDGDNAKWIAAARILAEEYRKAFTVLESIEEIYMDGGDTYEDWKAMGGLARGYFLLPNAEVTHVRNEH